MNYTYCLHSQQLPIDNIHRQHHDTIYGLAIDNDDELFGRLLLEINQAGLSWDTILKKESNFRQAYSEYSIERIARYMPQDHARLLLDTGIVRNRLKIEAASYNAQRVLLIQQEFGSFFEWIKIQKAESLKEWVKLFKAQFKFVGGEIVNEFLMTIGRIDGAHHPHCPRYPIYKKMQTLWLSNI